MRQFQVGGIALATSISATVNFCLLIHMLKKKIGPIGFWQVVNIFFPIAIASAVMGLTCFYLHDYLYGILADWQALTLTVVTAMLVYLVMGWILKIFKGFKFNFKS